MSADRRSGEPSPICGNDPRAPHRWLRAWWSRCAGPTRPRTRWSCSLRQWSAGERTVGQAQLYPGYQDVAPPRQQPALARHEGAAGYEGGIRTPSLVNWPVTLGLAQGQSVDARLGPGSPTLTRRSGARPTNSSAGTASTLGRVGFSSDAAQRGWDIYWCSRANEMAVLNRRPQADRPRTGRPLQGIELYDRFAAPTKRPTSTWLDDRSGPGAARNSCAGAAASTQRHQARRSRGGAGCEPTKCSRAICRCPVKMSCQIHKHYVVVV